MTTGHIKYRAHNAYDQAKASDEATIDPNTYGESLTVQAHAEDADLNVLMRRFGITGKMPDNPRLPTFGDFTNITDYRSALEATRSAMQNFMEIPAEVRARFDNDPQNFLEFCSNPNNLDEMRKLGLAKPAPPEPPKQAEPPQKGPPSTSEPPKQAEPPQKGPPST